MSGERKARKGARRRWRLRLPLILGVAVAVAAGAWWLARDDRSSPGRAKRNEYAAVTGQLMFPPSVVAAPTEMRQLYEFAARRPDVLHYLPCFCGCWRAGHKSNYDCFIDRVYPDGGVDIDEMGFT